MYILMYIYTYAHMYMYTYTYLRTGLRTRTLTHTQMVGPNRMYAQYTYELRLQICIMYMNTYFLYI